MLLSPLRLTFLSALLCVAACAAQSAPYDTTANSLLWKLTAPNGAVSHAFGTMHLRDSTILRQRDTVLALVKKARVFYAELDLDSMMSAIDPSVAMLPAGQTLATLYSPADLAIIRKALKERLGEMAAFVETMRPAVIVAMLMMEMKENSAPYGIDEFLWEFAKQANVPHKGIESPNEQIALLLAMPNDALLDAAKSVDSTDDTAEKLIDSYTHERLSEVVLMGEDLKKWPDFERSMNGARNAVMIDRLSKELVRGDIFIAVGALHLPGPNGILKGLESRGFKIEPVLGGVRSSWMPPPPPPQPVPGGKK